MLFIFWTAIFDPFGIDNRSETAVAATVQTILSSRYPSGMGSHIALIESSAADRDGPAQMTVPMSISAEAQLVDALVTMRVRAIFLDSEYRNPARDNGDVFAALEPQAPQEQTGIEQLAAAIGRARTAHVDVFVGPIGDRADLAPLRKVAPQAQVGWESEHPADYPLTEGGKPTAANLLYRAACRSPRSFPGCSGDLLGRLEAADRAAERAQPAPMALRFGGAFPDGEEDFVSPQDVRNCASPSLLRSLREGIWGTKPAPPCTHHLLLPASALLGDGNHLRRIGRLLEGRIVLVGLGSDLGDDHAMPGVGLMPGVAVHAMALDNLLTWGAHYPRWPADFGWPGKMGWDEVLKLVVLLGLPVLLTWRRSGMARRARRWAKRTVRPEVATRGVDEADPGLRRKFARELHERALAILLIFDVLAFGTLVIGLGVFATWLGDWTAAVAVMLAPLGLVVIEIMEPAEIRKAFDRLAGGWAAALALALLGGLAVPVLTESAPVRIVLGGLTLAPLLWLGIEALRKARARQQSASRNETDTTEIVASVAIDPILLATPLLHTPEPAQ